MSENEKGYYIREFSNMTGLPQSKIRYYEKIGLFKVKRMKNGYRWFCLLYTSPSPRDCS